MADKNQAVIDFLLQCPQIKDNPLFFNYGEAKSDNKQIVTVANDKSVSKEYIDGSVLKRYTFTIIDHKSITAQALVDIAGLKNESVEEMFDVQGIIDWIEEQEDRQNYPDFGEKCQIDRMWAATDTPTLNGIDTSIKPAIAKYSVSVIIEYLDISRAIW